jgi:hypothetical protein
VNAHSPSQPNLFSREDFAGLRMIDIVVKISLSTFRRLFFRQHAPQTLPRPATPWTSIRSSTDGAVETDLNSHHFRLLRQCADTSRRWGQIASHGRSFLTNNAIQLHSIVQLVLVGGRGN